MNDPVAVAVLAKAPLPGFAKSALIPAVGADGAASLQARLVERAVATACAAVIGPVTVWATPDESHPLFQAIGAHLGVALARQGDGDLGARMLAAIAAANAPALAIGPYCPALPSEPLRAAADALRRAGHPDRRRRLRVIRAALARDCVVCSLALARTKRDGRHPPPPQSARSDLARTGHAVGRGPARGSRAAA